MGKKDWSTWLLAAACLALAAAAGSSTARGGEPGVEVGGIVGSVLDDDTEEGIPHVLVKAMQSGIVVREATSGEQGGYHLPELRPGTYSLLALHRGYRPTDVHGIDVVAGEETEVDIRMPPYEVPPDFGAIVGFVRDEDTAEGLPGAVVKAIQHGVVRREARAGDGGAYRLPELLPGEYVVLALAAGYKPTDIGDVEVVAGQETELDILMPRDEEPPQFGAIVGVVKDDETGEGIPGALVKAMQHEVVRREARTGEGGAYRLPELRPGEYAVLARADGYEPPNILVADVAPGEETVVDFSLTPAAVPPGAGWVVGHVRRRAKEGVGIPGAAVVAYRGEIAVADTETGPQGGYELELERGTYTIEASAEGFPPEVRRGVVVVGGQETRVDFLLAPVAEFGRIVGRVESRVTGQGIHPAAIVVREGKTVRAIGRTEGQDGLFEIERLRPGVYKVYGFAPGYLKKKAKSATVRAGESTWVKIKLKPAAEPDADSE